MTKHKKPQSSSESGHPMGQLPRDVQDCSQLLSIGFQSKDEAKIEEGLYFAQRLFAQFVMRDQFEALGLLQLGLSQVYARSRKPRLGMPTGFMEYLGQLRAVINLCLYSRQIVAPADKVKTIQRSIYGEAIMRALLTSGALRATQIKERAHIPNLSQVSVVMKALTDAELVRRERVGRAQWYELTRLGRMVGEQYFRPTWLREFHSSFRGTFEALRESAVTIEQLADQLSVGADPGIGSEMAKAVALVLMDEGIIVEQQGRYMLARHRYPEAEPEFERRVLADVFTRQGYWKITDSRVSCLVAAAFVQRDDGRLLVAQLDKGPFPDAWSLPAGYVEPEQRDQPEREARQQLDRLLPVLRDTGGPEYEGELVRSKAGPLRELQRVRYPAETYYLPTDVAIFHFRARAEGVDDMAGDGRKLRWCSADELVELPGSVHPFLPAVVDQCYEAPAEVVDQLRERGSEAAAMESPIKRDADKMAQFSYVIAKMAAKTVTDALHTPWQEGQWDH